MSRFLLIGLDGAEPKLVETWMAEGRSPCLAALRARGTYMPLASTMPPATFPAWTSCVTGLSPGRHGIFDFTELVPDRYAVRFVNSTFRKAPALWNILSAAGRRVGVLGVPVTYPPENVNGFMVSGFDSPVCTRVDASFVYPPELFPLMRDWRFADFQETSIGPGWHERALKSLLDGIDVKQNIATGLLAREPWDFFMVVFGESDTVAHHFWPFHDSRSPRHQPGPRDAIRSVYERLDAAVNALIATAGPDVTVAVMSDHGFGGAGTGVVHLNNWLAENGFLRFAAAGGSVLKRMALSVTPESWRGTLFRRFRGLAERVESRSRFGRIDWAHTTAWSEELNYFPSIRLNLEEREPQGQVAPADYNRICADLCRHLDEWTPVRKAWRRDELYHGEHISRAPDIIIELALEDGYSHSCLRSLPHERAPFRRIRPDEVFGGKERGMAGQHRPTGVLFLSDPVAASNARIEDIAPTVLSVLGAPVPSMDGADLFGAASKNAAPPPDMGAPPDDVPRAYSPEEERIIEERLRALGYLE